MAEISSSRNFPFSFLSLWDECVFYLSGFNKNIDDIELLNYAEFTTFAYLSKRNSFLLLILIVSHTVFFLPIFIAIQNSLFGVYSPLDPYPLEEENGGRFYN